MKGPIRKTKVVLRHLPPTISQSSLKEQIDGRFAGLYNWISFRHGNNKRPGFRKKHPSYSRGYIDFKKPEDVAEFAKFFDGHVFVNEKGSQFKTIVELSPSQRVPRQSSKRDGREGTINKDSEYMEFVGFISKPVVHLPSAEIQLLRREAERAGSAKDALIVTPLMDFVRQKRAAKGGSGISLPNVKPTRTSGATSASPNSVSPKRGAAKIRISTTMVSGYLSLQHNATYIKNSLGSTTLRPNHRCEASGKIIKNVLLNNNTHQSPSSSVVHSEQQIGPLIQEKDKRPPRPPNPQLLFKDNTNGHLDDKIAGNDLHSFCSEKRTKNKDRPDRGVWIPLRRSVGSHASEPKQSLLDSAERSHKQSGGCCGPAHNMKDSDSSSILNKGKTLKRGGSSGYGSHEKQVWVQKSSLCS